MVLGFSVGFDWLEFGFAVLVSSLSVVILAWYFDCG